MEGVSDIAYDRNGIPTDETITCRIPTTVIPSVDCNTGSVSDVQNVSNHFTNNVSTNCVTGKEYLNGILPIHEASSCDNAQDDYQNAVISYETNIVSKVVSPTIFENAVNVVKNLFSPAKGHGIFSRGASQAAVNENNMKKVQDKNFLDGPLVFTLDQESPNDSQDKAPLSGIEKNFNLTEEANSSTTFNVYSLGGLDNTNDSYTTTVSRMDESFQSTITHFDENMPNEVQTSNEPVNGGGNCLDSSLNETMKTNENSLDNTLRKNVSICSAVNEDLNSTFEVLGKKEGEETKALNVESDVDSARVLTPNQILPDAETYENGAEVTGTVSLPEENFESFQEEEIFRIATSTSTPNKRTFSEKISSEKSMFNLVSGKFQEYDRINEENCDKLNNCTMEDMSYIKLSPLSGTNQSSENDFTLIPVGSEKTYKEKTSTPKSSDVEKNCSASTAIFNKNAPERLEFTTAEEETIVTDVPLELVQKNEPGIIVVNQHEDLDNNILGSEKKFTGEIEPESDVPVKDFIPSESNLGNLSSHPLKPDVANVEFSALNLTHNLQRGQLKPEGYPIDETGIPLASQKSYTVLHNVNPNLHRPVVPDYMCDVQVEKINNIILGDCAFSDLGVFNSCSEDLAKDSFKSDSDASIPHDPANAQLNKTQSDIAIIELNSVEKANGHFLTSDITMELSEAKQEFVVGEVFSVLKNIEGDSTELPVDTERVTDRTDNLNDKHLLNGTPIPARKTEVLNSKRVGIMYEDQNGAVENTSERVQEHDVTLPISAVVPASEHGTQSISNNGNNASELQFRGNGDSGSAEIIEPALADDKEIIEESGPAVENNSAAEENLSDFQKQMENLASDLDRLKMNDSVKLESRENGFQANDSYVHLNDSVVSSADCASRENTKNSVKASGAGSDTELTQFIQEQFTAFDIEKICSVVDDIPELDLSKNIVLASEKFDKSFHEKMVIESDGPKTNIFIHDNKFLSSALDFLDSIKGKGSGRDYSRESLYVKFDPLVQLKHSTVLLDISEGDKENLIISPCSKNSVNSEQLIPITPLKQTVNSCSPLLPLTPVTQKNESVLATEKVNKLWELQSEITRLKELSAQREETNKERMNNYEKEIAKLTGNVCVLEDKLKESEEMEKSLVKKLNVQNESMSRLKNIMEEYLTYIGKLTEQLEVARMESQKKTEALTEERDYYMNHLQSTEQAFSDVHSKYEKCKKTVEVYKKNEDTYRASIEDLKERIEQYNEKINDIQENAAKELNRLQEKINDMKSNHAQEVSRFKAQLRKTELKVQTIQEALDQKVKENQELARICDELIDGKK